MEDNEQIFLPYSRINLSPLVFPFLAGSFASLGFSPSEAVFYSRPPSPYAYLIFEGRQGPPLSLVLI